jgi:glutamyl-tRNA reductase
MEILVVGLNHRTAPLEIRERIDFSKYPADQYLRRLAQSPAVKSGAVLSTCNRVEVYATGPELDQLMKETAEFLASFHGLKIEQVSEFLYTKANEQAVAHLFRVASSLDSMVLGEPQILGQVKEAYFTSCAHSLTDALFDRLFQKAFSVAKKIRTETGIAQQAVSISFAAVELAKKIFGSLSERTVLVLGAGEMAELAARHLRSQSVKEILFANRTYENSVELAQDFGGIPIPFDQFLKHMPRADIVIVSTAAPHYLVRKEDMDAVLSERDQEPMFFIDISVPRNVDPELHDLENVYLYNIDDLKGIVAGNLRAREQEAARAEAIVAGEVEQFFRGVEKLDLAPIIADLSRKYGEVQEGEMARLRRRLATASEEDLKEIERSMDTLVRKILNDPILFLKEPDAAQPPAQKSELFRQVFALEKARKKNQQ